VTDERLPLKLLTILHPVACTECGRNMPLGTTACIPGWGQIAHWDACPDEDNDWEDDDWEEGG